VHNEILNLPVLDRLVCLNGAYLLPMLPQKASDSSFYRRWARHGGGACVTILKACSMNTVLPNPSCPTRTDGRCYVHWSESVVAMK